MLGFVVLVLLISCGQAKAEDELSLGAGEAIPEAAVNLGRGNRRSNRGPAFDLRFLHSYGDNLSAGVQIERDAFSDQRKRIFKSFARVGGALNAAQVVAAYRESVLPWLSPYGVVGIGLERPDVNGTDGPQFLGSLAVGVELRYRRVILAAEGRQSFATLNNERTGKDSFGLLNPNVRIGCSF